VTAPSPPPDSGSPHLKKVLGPVSLWGLGVGYVISGDYFGWNHGLLHGGTFGLLAAFAAITVMYVAFVFSYAEMACAIPRAGGVFVYGVRGLGLTGGFLGGIAQVIEFVFAPPAIAMAFGAYVTTWWPSLDPKVAAIVAYVAFTLLNIWGVQQAAAFELVVTILAVCGLVLFTAVAAPHFEWKNFTANAWPAGWSGALSAIPFAIWFYLAIEGVANAAEEARRPQRDVAIGFGAAIVTLVLLACCVFFTGVGVGGWERIVFHADDLSRDPAGGWTIATGASASDSPLPLALRQFLPEGHLLHHLLAGIGSIGIMASLNGIILIAGRALFEMGRVGFLPHLVGRAHPRTRTPVSALVVNMVIGILSILFLDTGRLITMAAMGAVTLYAVSMLALIRLRKREPNLVRPYRTPLYPYLPAVALVLSLVALVTMAWINATNVEHWYDAVTVWYLGAQGVAFLWYFAVVRGRLTLEDIAHFHRID
jgi:ethanolamine permease